MRLWLYPDMEQAREVLCGLNALVLTISKVVVNSLMEGLCEFRDTFALKIHQSIYAFNLSEEHIVFLGAPA